MNFSGTPAAVPLGTLGYAQNVAGQSSITTETDLTGLTVTVTVGTGRRIKITAHVLLTCTVIAANNTALYIKEGGTYLQQLQVAQPLTSATSLDGEVVLTPTAGTHTYKLSLQQVAGTGTIGHSAATTNPAFILVQDIGV